LRPHVELLAKHHDLNQFDCGKPALDDWLRKWALPSLASDSARTFVAQRDGTVLGYYSICTGSVRREEAPERIAKGQAAHPIPVILLARLAVDQREHGKGLGAALLKDALSRIAEVIDIVAARAVLVHAIDDEAREFYLHFDFEESRIDKYQLMLLAKDLRRNLGR
jgi:GNAT superfamily N-acetyltransferase